MRTYLVDRTRFPCPFLLSTWYGAIETSHYRIQLSFRVEMLSTEPQGKLSGLAYTRKLETSIPKFAIATSDSESSVQ